jgi:glycosyltransferase involved in cell wall biosynthesis
MKTCLLLPAYNVSRTVKRVIREANLFVGDIIVIDDGSRDETAEIALACGAIVLKHPQNCGKGMALRTGFDYAIRAGYQLIFTMDSDGQHNPSDLPRFLDHFRLVDSDILIGGRFENRAAMPLHRRLNNRLISTVGSALCGQHVPDFQSGYRLIKAEVLKAVSLKTERYETESELLIKASRLGFRIESIPIRSVYGDEISHIKPLREMRLFTKLLISSLRDR